MLTSVHRVNHKTVAAVWSDIGHCDVDLYVDEERLVFKSVPDVRRGFLRIATGHRV